MISTVQSQKTTFGVGYKITSAQNEKHLKGLTEQEQIVIMQRIQKRAEKGIFQLKNVDGDSLIFQTRNGSKATIQPFVKNKLSMSIKIDSIDGKTSTTILSHDKNNDSSQQKSVFQDMTKAFLQNFPQGKKLQKIIAKIVQTAKTADVAANATAKINEIAGNIKSLLG